VVLTFSYFGGDVLSLSNYDDWSEAEVGGAKGMLTDGYVVEELV